MIETSGAHHNLLVRYQNKPRILGFEVLLLIYAPGVATGMVKSKSYEHVT